MLENDFATTNLLIYSILEANLGHLKVALFSSIFDTSPFVVTFTKLGLCNKMII